VSYGDRYQGQGSRPPARGAHRRPAPPQAQAASRSGGADGNERLTAVTAAVLLVLLAVEGFTILKIGRLLTLHVFLGMLLLGPVALKAGSVLYRFARYYSGSAPYRRKGPPALLLRLLGPFVLLLTAGVFGTGVMLAVTGPGRGPWLFLHKASFILWACAMTVHVLAYLPRLPRLLAAEARGTAPSAAASGSTGTPGPPASRLTATLAGRGARLALLAAALLGGLVIALLTVHLAGQWHPGAFRK